MKITVTENWYREGRCPVVNALHEATGIRFFVSPNCIIRHAGGSSVPNTPELTDFILAVDRRDEPTVPVEFEIPIERLLR